MWSVFELGAFDRSTIWKKPYSNIELAVNKVEANQAVVTEEEAIALVPSVTKEE